ncbi:hypothetical protein [Frigidibacter mobilis]|uniref:Uncharacterized protein n=1 Tax=Frigidibacter mobilis TaxID=1335048 RepID=A0A159Z490_9RHOB|nr:hypothetical protein [Frigidibacter mobilis]AMY69060.1 hypothetical protein AKL17_1809 [Frigidibacter mobilis]
MPEFELTITGGGEAGSGFIASTPKGKASVYCIAALSAEFREIGALEKLLSSTMNHLQGRSLDGYTGKAFAFEVENQLTQMLPTLSAAISSAQEQNTKHATRRIQMLTFNMEAQPNQFMRAELRSWFMSHDMPNRIRLLNSADYALAVSVLEGGNVLAGIDDQLWNHFLDHAAALIFIKKVALDNGFRLKPTEENLTALGTDHRAVMDAANEAVKRYHAETELLKLAEVYLQSVVRALMLITNKSFDEIVF